MQPAFYERLADLLKTGAPFVVVTLVDVVGSAPQESGARMIVDSRGLVFGTVGGGKVEQRAIMEAQHLLQDAQQVKEKGRTRFFSWNLAKDIGMTCGGSVKVFLEAYNLGTWKIVIFGAGHCASALIDILVRLDCSITCIDTRQEWLGGLPRSGRLNTILVDDYVDGLRVLDDRNAFVLLLTMGHSSDAPLLLKILEGYRRGQSPLPYLGVIGSRAKAVRLRQDINDAGLPSALADSFFCPVGLDLGSNDPQEIAVSIAAQLLQVRDRSASAVQ